MFEESSSPVSRVSETAQETDDELETALETAYAVAVSETVDTPMVDDSDDAEDDDSDSAELADDSDGKQGSWFRGFLRSSDDAEDDDSDDAEDDDSDSAELADDSDDSDAMVVLYTTAQSEDLTGTVELDGHVRDYDGRAVRAVGCEADEADEQARVYRSRGRRVWTEPEWQAWQAKIGELATNRGALLPDVPREAERTGAGAARLHRVPSGDADCAPVDGWQEPEGESTGDRDCRPVSALDIPQEILEAEALGQAAKAMAEQYKALQEQMKLHAEQLKIVQAQAAAAKAAAPVLITPELRAKLDVLQRIIAGGEQSIAKALTNGVLFVRTAEGAKKDTGTVRKLAESARSNGVVNIHGHGSTGTVVAGGNQISEAKRQAIRDIRAVIATIPEGLVSDSKVARQLGLEAKLSCTAKQAATLVWHVKQPGSYPDVV